MNSVSIRDASKKSEGEYKANFLNYLLERSLEQVEGLLLLVIGKEEHVSVVVSYPDLLDFEATFAILLLNFPKLVLPFFEKALVEVQESVASHPVFERKHGRKGIVKKNCHVRLVFLPPTRRLNKSSIGEIRADESECLVQVSGTVVRTGPVRMLEHKKQYECQNSKCRHTFTVEADPEQDNMIPQPRTCPSKCSSTNLRELEGTRMCVDYQEIKIQDQIERLALGSVPRSIIVVLEADLVDRFNPGDDVLIVGTLLRQWRPVQRGSRCQVDIALRANSISALSFNDRQTLVSEEDLGQFQNFWEHHRSNDTLLVGRDTIVRSVCPQLFGLFYVKLALLLTLVGGSETQQEGGVKRRSQSHLLLVGDPGAGKSQILRFAASVVARSVLTTGIGTTGAGLTCTCVRDGADFSLEAGALVLSNDGVCCIDEFASIKTDDRAMIHEAMEQQTISVAKAGLVVKLNTRCSVVACCNPKGTFDITADLTTNTAIASPLLSRFDLVLILLDAPDMEWDKRVSTFLLQQALKDGASRAEDKKSTTDKESKSHDTKEKDSLAADESGWKIHVLRQYIAHVKMHFRPVLGAAARTLLMRYYQLQRQNDERPTARTTIRLLESLVRLSEAHAKIMYRNVVEFEDAVIAISCVALSQYQSSQLEEQNDTLHDPFPVDPQAAYQEQETKVLQMLHCSRESITREALSKVHTTSEVMSVADRLMVSLSQPSSSLKTSSKKRERGEEEFEPVLQSEPSSSSSSSTSVWNQFASETEDIDW